MPSNTPNLDLLKKDPITDGADTFNIETMLNGNWDKIDDAVGLVMTEATAAKQAGNERKAELVAALISKGVTATVADSWDVLYTKMANMVTAKGTALQQDVMAGRTFSTPAGNGLVGTAMPQVPNLIKNGSFENGLASWTLQAMTGEVLSDIVNGTPAKFGSSRISVSVPATVPEAHLIQTLKYVKNHKYYVCGHVLSGAPFSMDVYFPLIAPYGSAQGMMVGGSNVWKFFSGMLSTVSTVADQMAQVRIDVNNGNKEVFVWFDGLMLIDLTESFGAGKEPSQATMDAIVQGNGGYWESVIPTLMADYSAFPTSNTGYVSPKGIKGDGFGSIVIQPQPGYYEDKLNAAGYGAILAASAHYVPASIRADREIFGVRGSIPVLNNTNGGGTQADYHKPVNMSAWDGNLFLKPYPNAVYDPSAWIQVADPNFLARNIRAGTPMLGLTGTMSPPGIKGSGGALLNVPYGTISNLPFTPKIIVLYYYLGTINRTFSPWSNTSAESRSSLVAYSDIDGGSLGVPYRGTLSYNISGSNASQVIDLANIVFGINSVSFGASTDGNVFFTHYTVFGI